MLKNDAETGFITVLIFPTTRCTLKLKKFCAAICKENLVVDENKSIAQLQGKLDVANDKTPGDGKAG